MKRINCSNITIAWLDKKVISLAHVHSLEQRVRNAHGQNELTFYMLTVIVHWWMRLNFVDKFVL